MLLPNIFSVVLSIVSFVFTVSPTRHVLSVNNVTIGPSTLSLDKSICNSWPQLCSVNAVY